MQLLRVLLQANKNNLSLFTARKFSQPQTLSHQKIYYKHIMTYRQVSRAEPPSYQKQVSVSISERNFESQLTKDSKPVGSCSQPRAAKDRATSDQFCANNIRITFEGFCAWHKADKNFACLTKKDLQL